jgi:hypothetical protein
MEPMMMRPVTKNYVAICHIPLLNIQTLFFACKRNVRLSEKANLDYYESC